ncbi:MAG: GspE/PulE family protein [bacterium]|nr:GspE/PulE family protein [bacterium]
MGIIFDEEKQNKKIEQLRKDEEENLAKLLSARHNLPYLDLSPVPVNADALRLLSEEDALRAKVAVFNVIGKKIQIGVQSPNTNETKAVLKELEARGYQPIVYMVSTEGLKKVWARYKDLSFSFETKGGALNISNEEIIEFLSKVKNLGDVKKMIEEVLAMKKSHRISKILEIILAGALSLKASDIHIEPEESYVRLRYRLDGVLTDIINFDNDTHALLLSRIKLLSNLKLNIRGQAQDGRFSIKVGDDDIEIRTSVLPGAYNDSIVLRVLNPKSISVPLEELGIEPRLFAILEHEIKKPNGMILTTGPTGSGKTTTLYAFLKRIHSPEIKIITIENPIEYHLPGIVQTQTDSKQKYTFAGGLRSALRQDPDVIMVGEIRDEETAEIAINAALTGHLVFSTLHTNNAAGSFPRLIDLGVNPKVITSAINISMAQRLLRRLCEHCREALAIDAKDNALFEKIFATVKYREDIPPLEKIWRGKGCDKCNFTGYTGRVGIYEAILTDESIEKIVVENPSEREIKHATAHQGILDMRQDGLIKVLRGVTSLEELARVIDLEATD